MIDLSEEIYQKYAKTYRVYGVIYEITHRCPCNCLHCLLVKNVKDELSTTEIGVLFRQLRMEGAFQLSLTGGEIFLRDDLSKIFEFATKEGFFISFISTGILIGRPEVSLLKRHRIKGVEISILGANSETHDFITQFPGAFARMIRAVKMLREAGIVVQLKATILKLNWKELHAMSELARSMGARFSASASVTPRTDGDRNPQRLSLTEDDISKLDYTLLTGGLVPDEDDKQGLLVCNAGKTIAGISPQGEVFPCIILRHPVGSIRKRSFQDIWHDNPDPFLSELRSVKAEDVSVCHTCGIRSFCRRCPGLAYLETNSIYNSVPSACALARGLSRASMADSSSSERRMRAARK
jgi:radical SAM protein with 4Fe4S-binding SPASM domain